MHKVVFFFVSASAILLVFSFPDKYTTKFDSVNIEQILKNERLLKNYMDCLMERGACTPDGSELKRNIPDALLTDCSKCSEFQYANTKKVLCYLDKKKPDNLNELASKYDPEDVYRQKHSENLEKCKSLGL